MAELLAEDNNGGRPRTVCQLHEKRLDALEENQLAIAREISGVRETIGVAPDPLKGTPGTGLVGISYRMAAVVLRGENAAFASHVDDDEGEITKVQDRAELLSRAKAAEAALRERERQSERVRIGRSEDTKAKLKLAGIIAGVIVALASLAGNVFQARHAERAVLHEVTK